MTLLEHTLNALLKAGRLELGMPETNLPPERLVVSNGTLFGFRDGAVVEYGDAGEIAKLYTKEEPSSRQRPYRVELTFDVRAYVTCTGSDVSFTLALEQVRQQAEEGFSNAKADWSNQTGFTILSAKFDATDMHVEDAHLFPKDAEEDETEDDG